MQLWETQQWFLHNRLQVWGRVARGSEAERRIDTNLKWIIKKHAKESS